MYKSVLFRYMYAYAKKRCQKVYILSAKYGLLAENALIAPYNTTLNAMNEKERKKWAIKIMRSLAREYDLQKEIFLILGGHNYIKYLDLPNTVQPLEGLRIGKRLHWLKIHM